MQPRTPNRLILAFALLLPAVASQASAPGSLDARERLLATIRSVCANNPSQVCTTQLPNSAEFDPAQCPATPAPQACVFDFLPNADIRALLTVISDDPTPADTTTADVRVGVLLEFQIGEKHFVIAEQFTPGAKIADWSRSPSRSSAYPPIRSRRWLRRNPRRPNSKSISPAPHKRPGLSLASGSRSASGSQRRRRPHGL